MGCRLKLRKRRYKILIFIDRLILWNVKHLLQVHVRVAALSILTHVA